MEYNPVEIALFKQKNLSLFFKNGKPGLCRTAQYQAKRSRDFTPPASAPPLCPEQVLHHYSLSAAFTHTCMLSIEVLAGFYTGIISKIPFSLLSPPENT
jgi:hypothetical protein